MPEPLNRLPWIISRRLREIATQEEIATLKKLMQEGRQAQPSQFRFWAWKIELLSYLLEMLFFGSRGRP